MGIHFPNDMWHAPTEEHYRLLRLARPEMVKTLLFTQCGFNQAAVHRRLRSEHPDALIVARLFADMAGGPWPAGDFVREFVPIIEAALPYVDYFEIHNEPNLWLEWSSSTERFGAWVDEVRRALAVRFPTAKWCFPGQAVVAGFEGWWKALLPLIARFDAWGVHCYWQYGNAGSPEWGRAYELAHRLIPGMPILITEVGDATPPAERGTAEKARLYQAWASRLPAYVRGWAAYILGGTADWVRQGFDLDEAACRLLGDVKRGGV